MRLNFLARPGWLPEEIWPFETAALDVEGCRIAVTDVGRGPALLFVHTGMWSFVWRDVMLRLQADFRCVCFDAPGTGLSGRLPVREISLRRASRVVPAILEALNLEEVTLVFHDLGGPTGIAGAARVPGRIGALAAVNTFAWRPAGAGLRGMLAIMGSAPMREFDARTGILSRITMNTFGVGRHMDAESREAFRTGVGPDGLRAFHTYMHDARFSRIYEECDAALAGPFRPLPLVTIFGERNDPFGFQTRWKQMYPAARQVVVSKGNHFPMCDAPDLVAGTLRDLVPVRR